MNRSPTFSRIAASGTMLVVAALSFIFDLAETNRVRESYREAVLDDLSMMRETVAEVLEAHLMVAESTALAISAQEVLTEAEFALLARGHTSPYASFLRLDAAIEAGMRYTYGDADVAPIDPDLVDPRAIYALVQSRPDGSGYWLQAAVPIEIAEERDDTESSDNATEFVPFVAIVYDLTQILQNSGFEARFPDFDYLLVDPDDPDSPERPLAGNPDVFQNEPVSGEVRFANVSWQLAATPKSGWDTAPPTRLWMRLSILLFAIGAGGVVWLVLEMPRRRKQELQIAVADLQHSEQRYRSIIENAHAIVVQLSETGKIELFNQAASNIFGLSTEESLGQDLGMLLMPPERAYLLHECLRNSLRNGHGDRQVECIRRSGSNVWIHWSFKAIRNASGQVTGAIATGVDVTERYRQDQELRASEAELNRLLHSMTDAIFTLNRAGNYVRAFPTRAIDEFDSERLVGQSAIDVLGESVGRATIDQIKTCLDRGQPLEFEYCISKGDRHQWMDAMVSPFGDNLVLLVARDVSARHLAEEELRQAKIELEARVAARAGEINDANKNLQREVVERMQIEDALRDSEEREREKAGELQKTLRELKRAQAQLVQTEKMSSLGQLAAGMAHEINNPVNFIHGNISPLREYTSDLRELVELVQTTYPDLDEDIEDFLEEIDYEFMCEDIDKALDSMKVGTERIRSIIKSLQNFSRLDETGMKRVDLHDGIHSSINVLKSRFRATDGRPEIVVHCDLEPLPQVMCYPNKINQVAIDILNNAIDALTERYTNPETRPDTPPRIDIRTEPVDDDRVRITIADNANGMSKETVDKVFNPFFTTKPVGKGTGLGLSTAYQTIHDGHDGQLSCTSTIGEGSQFEIVLPIVNREKNKIQQSTESTSGSEVEVAASS